MATQLRIPIASLTDIPVKSTSIFKKPKSLYEVVSRLPNDGVGQRVTQARWAYKGILDSYYVVTRARLRANGTTGEVRGSLIWKGKKLSEEEILRGGHKYTWKHLPSPDYIKAKK